MVEILSVPLEDAKKVLVEIINDVNSDDVLKYTTTWTKGAGDTKLLRSLTIEVEKNIKKKAKVRRGDDEDEFN